MNNTPSTKHRLILAALIAAAILLRIWNIDQLSYFGDYDEYYTAKTAVGVYESKINGQALVELSSLQSQNFGDRLNDANRDNGNSFLYNLLLHYFSAAFDYSDYSMRLFSVIFDLLSVFFIWLIGRRLDLEPKRILLACALFTAFPVFINYAGIIRTYSFTTSMCLLLFYLIIRVRESGSQLRDILSIGFTGVAVFLGHFLTYYVLAVLFLFFLFSYRGDKNRSKRILLGLSLTALICGAFLLFNIGNLANFSKNSDRLQKMSTVSADQGNIRKLENLNISTLTPKTILYFDQFYTGNTYALKWVNALVGEKIMLITGAAILLLPLLLLLSISKTDANKKWIRLCMALLIAGHASALALTFISGHMIPLGIKYTMFTIPFFIMPVCFFYKNNMLVRFSLFVIIGGSLFTSFGSVPSKGEKPIKVQFDQNESVWHSDNKEEVIHQLASVIQTEVSDTLFVKTEPELIFIEMSGIAKAQRYAYVLSNDSTAQFANRVLPFTFTTPD